MTIKNVNFHSNWASGEKGKGHSCFTILLISLGIFTFGSCLYSITMGSLSGKNSRTPTEKPIVLPAEITVTLTTNPIPALTFNPTIVPTQKATHYPTPNAEMEEWINKSRESYKQCDAYLLEWQDLTIRFNANIELRNNKTFMKDARRVNDGIENTCVLDTLDQPHLLFTTNAEDYSLKATIAFSDMLEDWSPAINNQDLVLLENAIEHYREAINYKKKTIAEFERYDLSH